MLDELRMAPVLRGVRGEPAVDRDAIVRVIVDLGRLAVDWPEITEIELESAPGRRDGHARPRRACHRHGLERALPPRGPGSGQAGENSRGLTAFRSERYN